MKRNKWGIILSVALLVMGLAMPRKVLGGDINCPCGANTNGCIACGTTDVYCVKVTPNPVTDPLCGGDVKGCVGVILDCADDERPVWNSTILSECSQCVKPQFNTGQRTWSGNRIRDVAGSCGGCRILDGVEYCGQPVQRTDICTPKCPAGTVFTKVLHFDGCRNYDNMAGCDENRGQGSCNGANYRECWKWKPWQSYRCVVTCTPAAPAAPTLASPADGASVAGMSVNKKYE